MEATNAIPIEADKALQNYQPFHAAQADLLRRAGRVAKARLAYQAALTLTQNEVERTFLLERLHQLPQT